MNKQLFIRLAIGIIILQASLRISGLYTIVECPMELRKDIAKYNEPKPLQVSCTMQLLCPSLPEDPNRDQGYQVHEYDPDARTMCEVKLKINVVRNLNATETKEENPCARFAHHEHPILLSHSTNCSLVSFITKNKKKVNYKESIKQIFHFQSY